MFNQKYILFRISILTTFLIIFTVGVYNGQTVPPNCCSMTGQDPANGCSQQQVGAGSITCSSTIYCAGLVCTLEVTTRAISLYSQCDSGWGQVQTYASGTKVYAEGSTYGNYGQLVCSVQYSSDCLTGKDSGTESCGGSCG